MKICCTDDNYTYTRVFTFHSVFGFNNTQKFKFNNKFYNNELPYTRIIYNTNMKRKYIFMMCTCIHTL